MTLNVLKVAEKGSALNVAEHDANWTSTETEVNAAATVAASAAASVAGKLDANHASVTNKRVPVDGSYGFFTMLSGAATLVEATAAEVFAGTAGKPLGASRMKTLFALTTVASASGVLTLNWLATNIPTLSARVSVVENITSVAISNLPDYPCSVLFQNTGAFTVTLPAHNATVDGLTVKRVDGDVWPSLPTGNGSGIIVNLRKAPGQLLIQLGGIFAA